MENEWGLPPASEEEINRIVDELKAYNKKHMKPPQDKLGRFIARKVAKELPDYSKCLCCGRKEKEDKWKMTHFCSLQCFSNYKHN